MEAIDTSQIEALIANLTDEDREQLEEMAKEELEHCFMPSAGPQTEALLSDADILLFGGQAGGGKSALEVGAFFRDHYSAAIFRREATQLDDMIEFCKKTGEPGEGYFVGGNENVFKRKDGGRLKFAGLKQADDWRKHAGNARDLLCFDEAGEFLREQVFSLIGWLRSTRKGQRCRVILGSNPPRGGDGLWMIDEFAPWLDPMFPDPAAPGELRWAIVVDDETEWVEGPGVYVRGKEEYEAMSRTFIPATLDDNPFLKDTNYRSRLNALPEPLRSQLLHGDFLAGREDHEWQIIPSEWVSLAQERWRKAEAKNRAMLAISADIAIGGKDNVMIGSLHTDDWFSELEATKGVDVKDPITIANLLTKKRQNAADVSVDYTGGWGSGVKSQLENHQNIPCFGIVYSKGSGARSEDGRFGFKNLRAQMYWQFREALDPNAVNGHKPMLPPDPGLFAELTSVRWELRGTDILVESKDDIKKRLGRSTDRADVVVQLWNRRDIATRTYVNRRAGETESYVVEDDETLSW